MLRTEVVKFDTYYERLFQASELLDSVNIRILQCISRIGPRNLLEVSRQTGIPFSTVYHRIDRLENQIGRISHLVPAFSKIGLASVVILNVARYGAEEKLTEALKIPNYWWSVTRCEGGFTHHSVHRVPIQHLPSFQAYIGRLSNTGLATETRIIQTGDPEPFNLDFDYYDGGTKSWRFTWDKWLFGLKHQKPSSRIRDPKNYRSGTNMGDLIIVKELEKDGRRTLAELSHMLGMTLQGVKYHYDRLEAEGVCRSFWTNLFPFPIEVSAVYDIMLDFSREADMNRFYSFLRRLFFVLNAAKIHGKNSLLLHVYIPEMQVPNMFRFLSALVESSRIQAYSTIRLHFETRESQTISYELFDEKKGWIFDSRKCFAELKRIAPS